MTTTSKEDFERVLETIRKSKDAPLCWTETLRMKFTSGLRSRQVRFGLESLSSPDEPTVHSIWFTKDTSDRALRKITKIVTSQSPHLTVHCLDISGEDLSAALRGRPEHVIRVVGILDASLAKTLAEDANNRPE